METDPRDHRRYAAMQTSNRTDRGYDFRPVVHDVELPRGFGWMILGGVAIAILAIAALMVA